MLSGQHSRYVILQAERDGRSEHYDLDTCNIPESLSVGRGSQQHYSVPRHRYTLAHVAGGKDIPTTSYETMAAATIPRLLCAKNLDALTRHGDCNKKKK